MKYAWLLVLSFLLLSRAHDLEAKAGSIFHRIHSATQLTRRNECGFSGNPDIYGLGIRTGYYSQALSVWVANFFVFSESKKLRSVNTLFMFALFVGLIWISHNPSQTYAIEAFLLTQLLSATWYVSILDQSKFSKGNWKFSPLRMVIQDFTLLGILAYSIWFWWVGLDLMQKTPCGTYIFFLSKVSLYGWFRSGFRVLSVIAVCFNLTLMTGHMAQLVQHRLTDYTRNPDYFRTLREHLEYQRPKKGLPYPPEKEARSQNDPLAPTHKALAASNDYAITASDPIPETGTDQNLDACTSDTPQVIETQSAAEASQDHAERIATTQNIAENVKVGEPMAKQATSGGLVAQESNSHDVEVHPGTPTHGQAGSPRSSSAVLKSPSTSTPSKHESPGFKPLPLSGNGKLGTSGPVPKSPLRRSPFSHSAASASLHGGEIHSSQPPQVIPPFTLPSPSYRPSIIDTVVPSDPEAQKYVTTPLSFADINAAEVYLEGVLKDITSSGSVWAYHIPHTPIKISVPSIPHFQKPKLTMHKHRLRPNILIPLFIHVYMLRTYPFPLYPTLLSLALNSPNHTTVSHKSLVTAIAFRNTRLPNHTPPYHYLPAAFCTLTVCVGLVLAIELSLYWNNITGVANMGQVGQLVPLVVGIGGLVKVLWVWWRGGGEEEEGTGALGREIRACTEVYEGLKGRTQREDNRV